MATKGQKFNHYTVETKKAVVKEYKEKGTPLLELAYRYHIASQESIMQWIANYDRLGDAAFIDKRGTATSASSPLKGRPRQNFSSEEEKQHYKELVEERNAKKAQERKRMARAKKLRAIRLQQAEERYKKQAELYGVELKPKEETK